MLESKTETEDQDGKLVTRSREALTTRTELVTDGKSVENEVEAVLPPKSVAITFDVLLRLAIKLVEEKDHHAQQQSLREQWNSLSEERFDDLKKGIPLFGRNSSGVIWPDIAYAHFDAHPDIAKRLRGKENALVHAKVRDLLFELVTDIARWDGRMEVEDFEKKGEENEKREINFLVQGHERVQTCHAIIDLLTFLEGELSFAIAESAVQENAKRALARKELAERNRIRLQKLCEDLEESKAKQMEELALLEVVVQDSIKKSKESG